MVVFTCNSCGESLHKKKVEKHQFHCRKFSSVTCVDCFKDFHNDEYKAHVKCLTEEERYAAKGTPKEKFIQKGAIKQESWMDMIKSICDNEISLKPKIRNLLEKIANFSNVPRKKNKFVNFTVNCLRGQATNNDIEVIWNIIEKYKTTSATPHPPEKENFNTTKKNNNLINNKTENLEINENLSAITFNDITEIKHKKRKCNSVEETTANVIQEIPNKRKKNLTSNAANGVTEVKHEEDNPDISNEMADLDKQFLEVFNSVFNFQEKILEILNNKTSISIAKLQKKVLKSYCKFKGIAESNEKIVKKFNKKLKKIPNIKIDNNIVTLEN